MGGKDLIQGLVAFTDREDVRRHMIFLPNYDMAVVTELLPGCDVWLNNPLRPYEACGTSGMKAALNGALNLSTRDGWWDEWSDGENGWDILTAHGAVTQEERDDQEAASLYQILEEKVIPLYYDRVDGVPMGWLDRVRHTLATLGPKVQATRMVREYTERLYLPAARSAAAPLAPQSPPGLP
jgi:starch phosphorylase